jgi:monoamine oxidase
LLPRGAVGRASFDAIVIGAGAAGLAAARELSQRGLRLVLLEARGRLGGRVHTVRDPSWPVPVELGAEFVHGGAPSTHRVARAGGLILDELQDRHAWVENGRWRWQRDVWSRFSAYCRTIPTRGPDRPFAAYLGRTRAGRSADASLARSVVEGFHAAPADRISAQFLAEAAREESGPNRQFRLPGGYDAVITWLRAGLDPDRVDVRLNTRVVQVSWKASRVDVAARGALGGLLPPLRARRALVTLPLGVLKAPDGAEGAVRFEPPLDAKRRALEGLGTAAVRKVILRFRDAFWEEPSFVRDRLAGGDSRAVRPDFLHDPRSDFPTWWTPSPSRVPVLVGWAGGPAADRLGRSSASATAARALDALARVLHVPLRWLEVRLDGWREHDWQADPWARGAYSYPAVGGASAPESLARPLAGTLFFAGEATDADEIGTVEGAIASGRRAAARLAASL